MLHFNTTIEIRTEESLLEILARY